MPTYEYECLKCGKTFEIVQSMKDAPLTTCPKTHCRKKVWGKGRVKRKLSGGAGIIFKGSGFYITDYRSKGYQAAAKKEGDSSSPKSEPAKTSESKETKPKKSAAADK